MIQRQRRIVLFLPHRADPAQGVRVAADLTPLELLQIATYPAQEGYEIVLVDAMIHEHDYMDRLEEACDGALLLASSCILGFQVAHGARVAKKVREKFPDLPIVWGGWMPSVIPETFLKEGVADIVGLGQGELTFWEIVQALEHGTDLMEVPGLALLREGEVVYTDHRPVVGFDQIPPVPWDLLDFEAYVERQNNTGLAKIRHKYPEPWDWDPKLQVRGFSFFSSFGCPEPCTFCCSPMVTGRRWKAIPGKLLAEQLMDLHERFKFNIVRFQDANFGVAEKRSNEFCTELIERKNPFWWNSTYEIETIARYKIESVDLLQKAKLHMVGVGAEAGSMEQQEAIKKKIKIPHIEEALSRLNDRGIQSGTSWIIGYPRESRDSMVSTLRVASKMKHLFPRSASDIFPFRPIPGTEDYNTTVSDGYQAPQTLEEWGGLLDYKLELGDIELPDDVVQIWRRYGTTAVFYDRLAQEGSPLVRSLMQRLSGWRLRNGNYAFPIEHKLYHWYVKLTGQTQEDRIKHDVTSGVTPHAPM